MVILSCCLGFPTVLCNLLIFSIVTALARENIRFRPFAFKRLTALGICAVRGHKVAFQFVAGEAS